LLQDCPQQVKAGIASNVFRHLRPYGDVRNSELIAKIGCNKEPSRSVHGRDGLRLVRLGARKPIP